MYELITDKTLAEYEAFFTEPSEGHFAQSSLWPNRSPCGRGTPSLCAARTEKSKARWP